MVPGAVAAPAFTDASAQSGTRADNSSRSRRFALSDLRASPVARSPAARRRRLRRSSPVVRGTSSRCALVRRCRRGGGEERQRRGPGNQASLCVTPFFAGHMFGGSIARLGREPSESPTWVVRRLGRGNRRIKGAPGWAGRYRRGPSPPPTPRWPVHRGASADLAPELTSLESALERLIAGTACGRRTRCARPVGSARRASRSPRRSRE